MKENYIASQIGVRLEGKNVINLSRRNLSASEISLLSKGLKFVHTANKIDCAKLKAELKEYRRKLWLVWHFRNDERSFAASTFRAKPSFDPTNKDIIIETYLSCLEKRLLDNEIPSKRFNNLARKKQRLCIVWKMNLALSLKVLTRVLSLLHWTERILCRRRTDSLMIRKRKIKSQTTRVSLPTLQLKH